MFGPDLPQSIHQPVKSLSTEYCSSTPRYNNDYEKPHNGWCSPIYKTTVSVRSKGFSASYPGTFFQPSYLAMEFLTIS